MFLGRKSEVNDLENNSEKKYLKLFVTIFILVTLVTIGVIVVILQNNTSLTPVEALLNIGKFALIGLISYIFYLIGRGVKKMVTGGEKKEKKSEVTKEDLLPPELQVEPQIKKTENIFPETNSEKEKRSTISSEQRKEKGVSLKDEFRY